MRLALLVACATPFLALQAQGTPIALTLGDAARLAARQSLPTQGALLRADAADTRITQRRADLLPNFFGTAETNSRTFNTATLGLNFPTAPGQAPFFDPNGEVIGPVPTTDFRAHLQQNIYDPSVNARLRLARQQAIATRSEATQVGAASAAQAAVAYVRVLRAAAALEARSADSALAAC